MLGQPVLSGPTHLIIAFPLVHSTHRLFLLLAIGLMFASASFGQFVGEFALPIASTTYDTNQNDLEIGGWILNLSANNGGAIDTTGGPGSLVLQATGAAGFGGTGAGISTLTLSHVAITTATVSFTAESSGAFSIQIDGNPVDPIAGSSYAFNLATGSTLTFEVTAMGDPGLPGFPGGPGGGVDGLPGGDLPGLPGFPLTSSLTLSNFASIPEPAGVAGMIGTLSLGLAAWCQRRTRKFNR